MMIKRDRKFRKRSRKDKIRKENSEGETIQIKKMEKKK